MNETTKCFSCGAVVPVSDGGVHKYLEASPGCWEIFSEVSAREYSDFRYASVHNFTVDAYALQHPGNPSRQTIKSAAVHLISIFHQFEHDFNSLESARIKQTAANHFELFHWLEPPEYMGHITIADVYRARSGPSHVKVVKAWARVVWDAWSAHHETVKQWAQTISQNSNH